MLGLRRVLAAYRDGHGNSDGDVRVFDDAQFRVGTYEDGALFKFRGVIRDVLDPELVLLSDGARDGGGDRAVKQEQAQVLTSAVEMGKPFVERVPLKVALVPHMTPWACARYRRREDDAATIATRASTRSGKGVKRSKEDMEMQHEETAEQMGDDGKASPLDGRSSRDEQVVEEKAAGLAKRAKPDERHAGVDADTAAEDEDEEENELAVFHEQVVSMYVYDGQYPELKLDAFKVNESFEFVGVLDLFVVGSGGGDGTNDDEATAMTVKELSISECLEDAHRQQVSSVVFHCCDALRLEWIHTLQPHHDNSYYTQLSASNAARRLFLLSSTSTSTAVKTLVDPPPSQGIADLRLALVTQLTHVLQGDALAAEYVLLALLSRVSSRPDATTTLGNLSVNLSCPRDWQATQMEALVKRVAEALSRLVPMLATVELSIEALNAAKFAPHKDYERDLLRGGALQFAHGTTLLVNETVLSTGQLNEQGVKNMDALQSLVGKMLLPYDFQFYSMDFPQDVAVVSVSQGKSVLPVHVSVPIVVEQGHVHVEEPVNTRAAVSEELLDCCRAYLAVLRSFEVQLGNEQAERAEKYYVACRKAKQEVSIDDLHRWLRLVRLVAISHGEEQISTASWDSMLTLETQRIERLDSAAADEAMGSA